MNFLFFYLDFRPQQPHAAATLEPREALTHFLNLPFPLVPTTLAKILLWTNEFFYGEKNILHFWWFNFE